MEKFLSWTLAAELGDIASTINTIQGRNSNFNVNEGVDQFTIKNNVSVNNQNIQNDSDIFSKQVDEVVNGTFPERNMLTVSENTPQILQEIGFKNLPITLTQKHLETITQKNGKYGDANYHDLGIDLVKQLPNAIANPLNVLKSNTNDNSIVVITELADNQDRPVIASIKIDGTGRINDVFINSNVLTSAYGRNNYDKFMQDNISKGNLLYDIDEGIIKRVTGGRLQSPTFDNSSINNDSTNNSQSQSVPLPINNNIQKFTNNSQNIITPVETNQTNNKILNPNEISQLTPEDANTTPLIYQ